jgi:tRNA pseudouridine38-40 synthase
MVRNLVGSFLLLGKGTINAKDLKRILDLRDRSAAGSTIGPEGLYLVSVEY